MRFVLSNKNIAFYRQIWHQIIKPFRLHYSNKVGKNDMATSGRVHQHRYLKYLYFTISTLVSAVLIRSYVFFHFIDTAITKLIWPIKASNRTIKLHDRSEILQY